MRIRNILAASLAFVIVGAAVHANNLTIDQSGQLFSEKSLSLKPNDSVTFANRDDVSHNITIVDDDDEAVDLGLQKPGQSLSHLFDKAGRFKVRCSIHPSMKMTINVK
jgi:plastocyanin